MAGVQVIRKNKTNPWDNALGIIGQGIAGYAGGSMAKQRMDMMNSNNANMQKLLERMWGADGGGIQTGGNLPAFNTAANVIGFGSSLPGMKTGAANLPTEDEMAAMNGLFPGWR